MSPTRLVPALSLAMGMAIALALAGIADAILFRPLPVARPDEIVRIYSASPLHPLGFVSYPDFQDFARRTQTLSGVLGQTQILAAFGGRSGEPPEVHMGLAVTAGYFDLLGVSAQLGRTFRSDEARQPVVVLAESFWRRRLGGNRGIIGSTIQLSATPFTVIGIARAGFGLDRFLHEDFYIPIEVYAAGLLPVTGRPLEDRGRRYLSMYGRRRESLAAAGAELAAISASLAAEYPATNRNQKAVAMTELSARLAAAGTVQAVAWGLLALAVLSLVIACANTSGLLLLRREARAGETALKVALGATPGRLLREAFTEALAIATAGTAAAIPVTWAALKIAAGLWVLPTGLPMALDARVDARLATLAVGVTLAAALLCAAGPRNPARHITSLRSVNTNRALLSSLVIVQLALATSLAGIGASLYAEMRLAKRADLGYRTDHILLLTFDPSQARATENQTRAFYRELLDRCGQLSGIRAAALAQTVPLGFTAAQKQVKAAAINPDPLALWTNTVTPGYFELMRIPLLSGRGFTDGDTERSPAVAVINEAAARLWPDHRATGQGRQSPLGQYIEIDGRKVEVVGVVKTVKYQQPGESPKPFLYLPYSQNFVGRMTLHVLTESSPATAAPPVVAAAHGLDPSQPVTDIRPFDELLSQGALFGARIGVAVMAAAGGCAWLMSLTGLYVCVANTVARRQREIGIRCALGATRGAILRLILAQSSRFTAAGVATGLLLAAAVSRWIMRAIFPAQGPQAQGLELPALAITGAVVAATSLTACFVPAWRASRHDPAITLRRQ